MRHSSNQRRLILLAGIFLLIATFWMGGSFWFGTAVAQEAGKTAGRTPIVLNTKPVRVVSDSAPVLSGIAIDTQRDEVFMTNDKESAGPSVMVYPTQFQPTDRLMEPRRRLAGPKTNLALPCGVAVSPEFQEMFAVSGDGQDINIFPLKADALSGDSKFAYMRGSFSHPGIVEPLGPSSGKFMPPSIMIFSRTANGDVGPLRTIQGPHTRLNIAVGITRDPDSGEIVVANSGDNSILFFDANANGDVAPVRVLAGPATNLKGATGVAIDTKHNELWVTSWENHIAAVFPRKAQGNIAPLRMIHSAPKGAPLATMGRLGAVAFDPKRQEILTPN